MKLTKEERRASKYDEVAREMREMVEPEELEVMAHLHVQKIIDTAGHPGWDWTTQDIVDAYKAGWHFRDNSLNWVRDLVDYGIRHPDDAVEYLKRIKDLLK